MLQTKKVRPLEILRENKEVSTKLVDSLFEHIKNKYNELNLDEIHASKGNITKFSGYKYIKESIAFTEDIFKNETSSFLKDYIEGINQCSLCLENLETLKKEFEKVYTRESEIGQMFYSSMVLYLLTVTSTILSISIDFIRQPNSSYLLQIREVNKGKVKDVLVYIKQLKKFNQLVDKGDIKLFLDKITQDSVKEEGFEFSGNHNLSEGIMTIIGSSVAFLFVLLSVLFLMRYTIYLFYKMSDYLVDYLDYLKNYVEMNVHSLKNQNARKDVIKKQEEYANTLNKLARKIEEKVFPEMKQVEKQIEKENKTIKVDEKKTPIESLI